MTDNSLIHADVFFFVSTIAVIVITIGIGIASFYLIRILKDVREISELAKVESKKIAGNIEEARSAMRAQGQKFTRLVRLFKKIFKIK